MYTAPLGFALPRAGACCCRRKHTAHRARHPTTSSPPPLRGLAQGCHRPYNECHEVVRTCPGAGITLRALPKPTGMCDELLPGVDHPLETPKMYLIRLSLCCFSLNRHVKACLHATAPQPAMTQPSPAVTYEVKGCSAHPAPTRRDALPMQGALLCGRAAALRLADANAWHASGGGAASPHDSLPWPGQRGSAAASRHAVIARQSPDSPVLASAVLVPCQAMHV